MRLNSSTEQQLKHPLFPSSTRESKHFNLDQSLNELSGQLNGRLPAISQRMRETSHRFKQSQRLVDAAEQLLDKKCAMSSVRRSTAADLVDSEASTATARHLASRPLKTQNQCYITYNMHSEKFAD